MTAEMLQQRARSTRRIAYALLVLGVGSVLVHLAIYRDYCSVEPCAEELAGPILSSLVHPLGFAGLLFAVATALEAWAARDTGAAPPAASDG